MSSHKHPTHDVEVNDPALAMRKAEALGRRVLAVPKSSVRTTTSKKRKRG